MRQDLLDPDTVENHGFASDGIASTPERSAGCAHITTGSDLEPAQSDNSIRNSDGLESCSLAARAKHLLALRPMARKKVTASGASGVPMREMLAHLRTREAAMVRMLGELVRCESFSYDKKAVDAFGAMVAREWKQRGADVRVMRNKERGNNLRIGVAGDAARRGQGVGNRTSGYGVSDGDDCEDSVSCGGRTRVGGRGRLI